MVNHKKRILIDLDGVLNNYHGNYDEAIIPPIKNGAKDFIKELYKDYELYLFTSRNLLLAAKWLIENGIEENRVIVEANSLTTAQNAIFTYDILTKDYPSVTQVAIVSSDYHIATGTLLFEAEAILRASGDAGESFRVVSNAAWEAPSGSLSGMFQAGALIELSGDTETAFEIYYDTYDIHELPPLNN